MIGVIDYGMGNLHSILKALQRIQEPAKTIASPTELVDVDCLVLPGVGHFKNGMNKLTALGFVDAMNKWVKQGKPLLGICLGAQLLTDFSEEGNIKGLGFIPGQTINMKQQTVKMNIKIPHIGWNSCLVADKVLFNGIAESDQFYFVHSYHIQCQNADDAAAITHYGIDFHSVIRKGNVVGIQFHPEKSHDAGLLLLKNFFNQTRA